LEPAQTIAWTTPPSTRKAAPLVADASGLHTKKKDTQLTLFDAFKEVDADERAAQPELKAPQAGSTVLDRVHQAMNRFAAGRGDALKRFLVEEGTGKDARFWTLAQSLSALYPPGIDEKRRVDVDLARKKGLGL
jgi:putative DNA methylase